MSIQKPILLVFRNTYSVLSSSLSRNKYYVYDCYRVWKQKWINVQNYPKATMLREMFPYLLFARFIDKKTLELEFPDYMKKTFVKKSLSIQKKLKKVFWWYDISCSIQDNIFSIEFIPKNKNTHSNSTEDKLLGKIIGLLLH